jgi:hypothetical protein
VDADVASSWRAENRPSETRFSYGGKWFLNSFDLRASPQPILRRRSLDGFRVVLPAKE